MKLYYLIFRLIMSCTIYDFIFAVKSATKKNQIFRLIMSCTMNSYLHSKVRQKNQIFRPIKEIY